MSEDTRDERQIFEEDFLPYYEEIKEHSNHSIDQVDLMVYGLAAGGIYACFQIMKFCVEEDFCYSKTFLMSIGLAFLVSIILQIASNWFGFATSWKTLSHMSEGDNWKLYLEESEENNAIRQKDRKQQITTHVINFLSSLFLIFGMAGIVIFMMITF